MGFVEKLRKADADRAQQLKAQQEAQEKARLQKEENEAKYHAQRKGQAERFHEESGVGAAVSELVGYLRTPTVPVEVVVESDGFSDHHIEYRGRGGYGFPNSAQHLHQRDPDSVILPVHWDHIVPSGYGDIKCSYKYLAVETCPDGDIVFHGSRTVRLNEWRTKNKEDLFDKALERAFNNQREHRYSLYRREPPSFG